MAQRPRGTVTFLFTDVEGSTRLLKQLRDRYGAVLAEHQRQLRTALAAHGGEEVDTQGDAFFYVFSRARDAAAAAADGQRALASHNWPEGAELRVRMGLHTGEPVLSDEGRYHGMGVHRTARIMAAGHGGQILASQSTASVLADDDLEGFSLRDLGEHNLKDLAQPERIYELQVDGLQQAFAPLKTESAVVVPTPLYRRPVVIGAFAGVVAAAIAIPVFAFGGGSGGRSLSGLSANSVGIVDATSGAINDEVPDVPTPTRVAAGEGAIWVTSSDTNSVSLIDASSHELRDTIRVGDGPTGIALGAGDVWVANTLAGTVSRIDPEAIEVVGNPIRVGNSPTAIAFGEGSVWVANVDDRTVSRIDPKRGVVQKTIDVGAAGRGITAGGGAIWIGDSAQNRVVRLDPNTNRVTQAIGVGSGPSALAFGAGAVWVANALDGTVSRIDPASNQVRSTVTVGATPNAIAATDDSVWVANEADPTIVRLDPRTGNVVQTVRTGARPTGLTLAGSLWVAGQASAGTHRGGTLVVADAVLEKEVDPALGYTPTVWGLLTMTNDGLVGFKRVGGSEGAQLVPDLATSLPAPTDAGKTYAFQLRKGIRFSNGASLKASDVRSTFERLFKAGTPRLDYYASIRGGSACSKRPKACDLSAGIVTDDTAGTVTFHLRAPDPEFLYKLAIPFGSIVPADTPLSKDGARPVPGTGPYVIRSATPKRLILERNRHFRAWNAIAQPDGYVNRIEVTVDPKTDRAATDVARGAVDVVSTAYEEFGAPLANFETQHPAQVHTTPAPATFFWFLNTRVPPFDDGRARQAVSYALDREQLAQIHGGHQTAQVTCQLLPPNFPGYRPYCPFTADASAGGTWSAPDLARAHELVRQSGTTGARVVFWSWNAPAAAREAHLARLLFARLGYRASVKLFPDVSALFDALAKAPPRGLPQAAINGWFADYPAASNFFGIVSCSTVGTSATNPSGFCSHELDAKVERASVVQAQDQDAAVKLWADADRDLTNLAPVVPTYTPRNVDLVSKRVGNYQHHPLFGVLLDQLWVQ
jgi:YVTN family beta-propeller protein